MPGRDDCPGCPFRTDPVYTCWCAANGFVGICQGLNGERGQEKVEGFRRIVIERTTGKPADPADVIAPGPVPFVELPDAVQEARRKAYLGRFYAHLAEKCPARGEKIGSGCNCTYVCRKGHGWFVPGEVSIDACFACLKGDTPKVSGV